LRPFFCAIFRPRRCLAAAVVNFFPIFFALQIDFTPTLYTLIPYNKQTNNERQFFQEGNMSFKGYLAALAMTGAAFLFTGCIDNSIPNENDPSNRVPTAANDSGRYGYGRNGDVTGLDVNMLDDQGFASGADSASLGAYSDTIDWDPIEGVEFPIIYFDFDKDVVKPDDVERIKQVISYMADYPELGIIIEGHTDDVGTNEYNRALGERRAISTQQCFGNNGFSIDRIQTISYGEDRPAANGTDMKSRALNRRAVLIPAKMK